MGNEQNMSIEKRTLADKLRAVILLETSKPYKEMNSDLVTECVEFLMDLEGTERLTKSEIEQRVNDIPFKGKPTVVNEHAKKKIRAKRLIVIAAVLAILAVLGVIFATSFTEPKETPSDKLVEELKEHIVCEMYPGEIEEHGNIDLVKAIETRMYDNAEELVEEENIKVLYPRWLPRDVEIENISYAELTFYEECTFAASDPNYTISFIPNASITDREKEYCKKINLRGLTVYYFEHEDGAQAMFEYNNCLYTVSSLSVRQVLLTILLLKEID